MLFPEGKENCFLKKDIGFLLFRGFSVMIACDYYSTGFCFCKVGIITNF